MNERVGNEGERTRVALIITELSAGGAEKALVELALRLDPTRFEPVVFTLSGLPRDQENTLAPILARRGIEVVPLDVRGVASAISAIWRLSRLLKRGGFQVAQGFMFHANILGRLAARLARTPVFCAGVRVAERDAPRRLKIDRLFARLCDRWVCVSESVARFTVDVGGIEASRVVTIPNGASTTAGDLADSAAPPLPDGWEASERKAVAVGRLARQKGFDELLSDADSWLLAPRQEKWTLWIFGEGEERESLERIVSEKGLGEVAFLPGWRSDVRRLLEDADLFLLPSRWEGMPNALLEAASLGKACLCRNAEGVAEILGAGAQEQVVESASGPEWRAAAVRLMSDADLRARLGASNRSRAESEFSSSKTARRYEELWTTLLAERAREKRYDDRTA